MVSIDDNSMIANCSCSGTHCEEPVFATVRASVPVINKWFYKLYILLNMCTCLTHYVMCTDAI